VKTITLQFPSFIYLTAFRKYSKAKHWEINLSDLTVLCDCSEKEANFACADFKAVVLNATESVATQTQNWKINTSQLAFSIPSQ
jgi:hypothetical protein